MQLYIQYNNNKVENSIDRKSDNKSDFLTENNIIFFILILTLTKLMFISKL